eukprot:6659728-Pyramimonas_sp.AAC.1
MSSSSASRTSPRTPFAHFLQEGAFFVALRACEEEHMRLKVEEEEGAKEEHHMRKRRWKRRGRGGDMESTRRIEGESFLFQLPAAVVGCGMSYRWLVSPT